MRRLKNALSFPDCPNQSEFSVPYPRHFQKKVSSWHSGLSNRLREVQILGPLPLRAHWPARSPRTSNFVTKTEVEQTRSNNRIADILQQKFRNWSQVSWHPWEKETFLWILDYFSLQHRTALSGVFQNGANTFLSIRESVGQAETNLFWLHQGSHTRIAVDSARPFSLLFITPHKQVCVPNSTVPK